MTEVTVIRREASRKGKNIRDIPVGNYFYSLATSPSKIYIRTVGGAVCLTSFPFTGIEWSEAQFASDTWSEIQHVEIHVML